MNQVRFTIGVPKAGSAARTAENSVEGPSRSILPGAGSSARDAEERNRAEGLPQRRAAAISMRAAGGRAFGPAAPEQLAGDASRAVTGRSQTFSNLPSVERAWSELPNASAPQPSAEGATLSPGPTQTAAGRFKSLVQSLFVTGDSANKS